MSGYVFDDNDNHYALSCVHQKILQHCDIPAGELIGLVMSSMLIPSTTETLVDNIKVILQDYGIDCDHNAYGNLLKDILLYCDMYRYQTRGIHISTDHDFTTHTTDECALLCVEENVNVHCKRALREEDQD